MKKLKIFIILNLIITCVFFFNVFSFSLLDSESKGNQQPVYLQDKNSVMDIIPPLHTITSRETIYMIADTYNISLFNIVRFNNFLDARVLIPGDSLIISEGINQLRKAISPGGLSRKGIILPRIITIKSTVKSGILPLKVKFFTLFDLSDNFSFVWDFGTGSFGITEHAEYTYLKPGKYDVRLSVSNEWGDEVLSNILHIKVKKINFNSSDIPFLVIDHVNGELDLKERIIRKYRKPLVFNTDTEIIQDPVLIEQTGENRFLAVKSGYTKVTLKSKNISYDFFLFVSPFPTQHSVEPDYNWYKTQFDTGMYGNCGPACVAMAIHWANGKAISVVENREEIGLPIKSGAISYYHMVKNMKSHKIKTKIRPIDSFNDIKSIIDKGNIAIILFDTTYLQPVQGDKTLVFVDRYYPDTTGHYVIIKGYTLDKKYFVVYDPIPGDWQTNEFRYQDGISMIGRNRYFLANQVLKSLKGNNVIEIWRRRD